MEVIDEEEQEEADFMLDKGSSKRRQSVDKKQMIKEEKAQMRKQKTLAKSTTIKSTKSVKNIDQNNSPLEKKIT